MLKNLMYSIRIRDLSSPKKNNEADSHRTEHVLSTLKKVSVIMICSLFISPVTLLSQTKEAFDLKKIKTGRHSQERAYVKRDIPKEASKYLLQSGDFTEVSKDVNRIEKNRLNDNASKSRKNSLAKSCNAVENGNTADLKISNPRVDGDYFKFEIQIRRTNTWEFGILENVLGNTDFYFNRNANGFTGSPGYENLHTDLSGNNYTCTAQENEGKLQFKIVYSLQDLNFFKPALDVYNTVCTVVWEIADPTESTGVTWDQVNTGALSAASNAINLITYDGSGDISLPVILSTFTATVSDVRVILEWVTESEIENLGFILERRNTGEAGAEDWKEIANYITHEELQGQGDVTHRTEYRFVDNTVKIDKTYDYHLANVSYDGVKEYHSMTVMGVTVTEPIPDKFTLRPAYPNPFNPVTTISYDLPKNSRVELVVYNILGQKVVKLVDHNQVAGRYTVQWNGQDTFGRRVSSGVYFYLIIADEFTKTRRMLLLK